MVRCTGIRLFGGFGHEHITHIAWVNEQTGARGTSTRAEMVQFVADGNVAFVRDRNGVTAKLRVNVSVRGVRYVETVADRVISDNLLSLQRI